MSHAAFLHLTSSKEKLEKTFAENFYGIEILLESQGRHEEKLHLLMEKIKELRAELDTCVALSTQTETHVQARVLLSFFMSSSFFLIMKSSLV